MTRSIQAIIEQQISRWNMERDVLKKEMVETNVPKPVITISRLLGSGGSQIAIETAKRLDCQLVGIKIMDEIAHKNEIRKELVDAMDEKFRSTIDTWIDKIAHGQTLDDGDQSRYLLESINYFIRMGSVVMLGRGAYIAPRTRPRIDVRIVAPTEHRIDRLMQRDKCSREEATLRINASDDQRTKFIRKLFGRDWWDAREYDFVINTANTSVTSAVAVIEAAWLRHIVGFSEHAAEIKKQAHV